MALHIVLSVKGIAPEWQEETSIYIDDITAEYAYLNSSFIPKLKSKTSEFLDPYDDAEFSGNNLESLNHLLIEEINQLKNNPLEKWDLHVGTQTYPVKKELYDTLNKNELIEKLEKFLTMTKMAIEKNEKIFSLGD